MPYDQDLARRIRKEMGNLSGLTEKEMFGGVGFLLNGNMACGVHKDKLIVRVGPANYDKALAAPVARQFDITGRPMKGWVMVEAGGFATERALKDWVRQGIEFARTLPPK